MVAVPARTRSVSIAGPWRKGLRRIGAPRSGMSASVAVLEVDDAQQAEVLEVPSVLA